MVVEEVWGVGKLVGVDLGMVGGLWSEGIGGRLVGRGVGEVGRG